MNAHNIIASHIAGYEAGIERYQADIRESYDHGQTNVDAKSAAIGRLRERIAALQRLDGELSRNEEVSDE